jgi:hypothetical protein
MARPCCGLGTARRARFASRPSPASGLERSTADGADLPLARRRRNVARASHMAAAVCSRLRSMEGLSTIPFSRPVGSLRRSQGHSWQVEQSRADVRVRSRRALPPCSAPERRPVRAARCQLGSPFGSPLLPIEAPGHGSQPDTARSGRQTDSEAVVGRNKKITPPSCAYMSMDRK